MLKKIEIEVNSTLRASYRSTIEERLSINDEIGKTIQHRIRKTIININYIYRGIYRYL